jgi:hypothetical protein
VWKGNTDGDESEIEAEGVRGGNGGGTSRSGGGGGRLEFSLGLLGDVQLVNAGVAVALVRELQKTDVSITDAHLV